MTSKATSTSLLVGAYRGYCGHAEYDANAKIYHGRLLGIRDVISFEGRNWYEARAAFMDSVDVYLKWCAERGEKPNDPVTPRMIEDRLKQNLALTARIAELEKACEAIACGDDHPVPVILGVTPTEHRLARCCEIARAALNSKESSE